METAIVLSPLSQEIERRRTFAIVSHPDAGKTTITEKFLLYGGAVHLAGSVTARKNQRASTSDWLELERKRGISISSTVLQFDYEGYKINLLDTPGHQDFSEDTYRVLTAVDAAIMVIDAGKGIEAQTLKLFEVCKHRGVPIFTFINKLDRPAREPFDLLDQIEKTLGIATYPVNWPLGTGPVFRGVWDRQTQTAHLFERTTGNAHRAPVRTMGLNDPFIREQLDDQTFRTVCEEVETLELAGTEFNAEDVLAGRTTPVYFGSALNNFGVQLLLDGFLKHSCAPAPRTTVSGRVVPPSYPAFSGFVFKIQANMDPNHRDRIAFFRVCSGQYTPGMKVKHRRTGKEIKIANAVVFMANERTRMEEAYAGDIIGIHNHGQLQIGDALCEGTPVTFKGIPYFAPDLFSRARLRDPLKSKQLQKGLQELGEEGAIQVFTPMVETTLLLGAVGQLQFEVVEHRLKSEYGVDAIFERSDIHTARWVTCNDVAHLAEFTRANTLRLGHDVDGNLVFLSPNSVSLGLAMEKWPKVQFHNTREHGQRMAG